MLSKLFVIFCVLPCLSLLPLWAEPSGRNASKPRCWAPRLLWCGLSHTSKTRTPSSTAPMMRVNAAQRPLSVTSLESICPAAVILNPFESRYVITHRCYPLISFATSLSVIAGVGVGVVVVWSFAWMSCKWCCALENEKCMWLFIIVIRLYDLFDKIV